MGSRVHHSGVTVVEQFFVLSLRRAATGTTWMLSSLGGENGGEGQQKGGSATRAAADAFTHDVPHGFNGGAPRLYKEVVRFTC